MSLRFLKLQKGLLGSSGAAGGVAIASSPRCGWVEREKVSTGRRRESVEKSRGWDGLGGGRVIVAVKGKFVSDTTI